MKKLQLAILAVLAIALISILASCGSLSPADRYAREHRNNNYEYMMRNNESFTLGSAKEGLKKAEQDKKDQEKEEQERAKIDAIRAKTAEVRKN
jgi:hypothetical protein